MKRLAATAALVLAAGCGGQSDADQVRDVTRRMIQATLSDHPERACVYMVDRSGCVSGVIAARTLGIDVGAATNYPDDWSDRVGRAHVVISDDRATMSTIVDGGHEARYLRRNGHWLADNR
jgi:hypothetical protein